MPAGLVIDPATGVISGTPTAEGTTDNVVFIYTDPDGKAVRSAAQRVTIAAPAPNYTLSFETKGGSVFASVTKKAGTVIDLSAYVPIKDGFTFDGWYSDPALTVRVTSVTLERNMLVYAKWLPAAPADDIITITFDPRNGDPAFTEDIRKGTNAHTPPRPSRSGYTFRGWFTALIGGDRVDFDSMTFDSATTLYAHWEYTGSSSGGGSGSGGSSSGTTGDANTNNSATPPAAIPVELLLPETLRTSLLLPRSPLLRNRPSRTTRPRILWMPPIRMSPRRIIPGMVRSSHGVLSNGQSLLG